QANALVPGVNLKQNWGPSDFDTRNAFSMALTYNVPSPRRFPVNLLLRGWSADTVVQGRSALPLNVYYSGYGLLSNFAVANVRPDIVMGQPLYLYGGGYPGGKRVN